MGKLSDRKIRTVGPGMYGDGHGLWLNVRKDGTRAWVFRYMLAGRARAMGLGPLHTVSLAQARELATTNRGHLLQGIDPIDERRRKRAAAIGRFTFKQCAEKFLEAHEGSWRNVKHRKQWASTLKTYAYPHIGDLPVNSIGTAEIMRVLEPIWHNKTETAKRLRGRVERVLDWAKVREYREGDNPARWRGHLDNLLPKPSTIAPVRHHPALPFDEIPEFMTALRESSAVAPKALEFAILTASRSGEVRGMTWDEIKGETWTVPAERMKADKEHRVPLSERALAILEDGMKPPPPPPPKPAPPPIVEAEPAPPPPQPMSFIVFGSLTNADKPLSDMTLLAVLKRMGRSDLTVHGFRSTFRDWISERTAYPSDVAEAALAHTIANKVQVAYQRGDLFEKRCKLMEAWADYCTQPPAEGKVVPIGKARR